MKAGRIHFHLVLGLYSTNNAMYSVRKATVYAMCGIGMPIIVNRLTEVPWFAMGCVRGPNTSKAHLNEIKGRLGIRKTATV